MMNTDNETPVLLSQEGQILPDHFYQRCEKSKERKK
jgi:hypothetical protein